LKLDTFKRDANERLYFVYTKLWSKTLHS
jgi:hypothetical protein